ncbi:glycoside hydrolase family 31 protein [candidate division KSB1 bacterium]|nr:glycoside hydrolase family 31 protein [candidate division KSB1 bacterium]
MKRYRSFIRLFKIIILISVTLSIIFYFYIAYPFWGFPLHYFQSGRVPITPAWALECWLWEDDDNTASRVDELLEGYARYDIPVRTIILDSPWSLRYNDFRIDENRYPNPDQWFTKLEAKGYRVVLWMTTMVNSYSKDPAIQNSQEFYEEAKFRGYLAGDGHQVKWWKGKGGFIDYTNPDAMKWWRELQYTVFKLGIDGWKLDGTATFFSNNLFGFLPVLYQRTSAGWMTTRTYMDNYYRHEYLFGKSQNPEFVTLARAIDRPFIHPEGYAPLDAAPVTWVGDQRHTWKSGGAGDAKGIQQKDIAIMGDEGIEEAIRDILLSAKRGYCVIGSDIAGFSGSTIPPRLYIRWAQFSTFCGLFMNGGHGERALWKRSQRELEIIRKFSWLHTELIPYMYSHIVRCHEGGKPLQCPIDGKYHYLFGDDLLIAPIYQDSLTNTIHLPEGKWRYFFDDQSVIEGPVVFLRDFPLEEYPVYVREGAIIPLNVTRAYTNLGDSTSTGFVTWLIYPGAENQFTMHYPDGTGNTTLMVENEFHELRIALTGDKKAHILRILLMNAPKVVQLDGKILQEGVHFEYSASQKHLIVKTTNYEKGEYRIITTS